MSIKKFICVYHVQAEGFQVYLHYSEPKLTGTVSIVPELQSGSGDRASLVTETFLEHKQQMPCKDSGNIARPTLSSSSNQDLFFPSLTDGNSAFMQLTFDAQCKYTDSFSTFLE